MSPKRIQMSRQKPWRADNPDAVIVARPSKWGNPFTAKGAVENGFAEDMSDGRAVAAGAFRDWLNGDDWAAGSGPEWEIKRLALLSDLRELAGRDLACWCRLDGPCHADALLELANPEATR